MYAEVYRVVEPKRKRSVDLRLLCVYVCVCVRVRACAHLMNRMQSFGNWIFFLNKMKLV